MKTLHAFRRMCFCIAGIALIGCGSNAVGPRIEAEETTLIANQDRSGPPMRRFVVVATVTQDGAPLEGIKVMLTRFGDEASHELDPQWTETTTADGQVEFDITTNRAVPILSGYYGVQAIDLATDCVIGKWRGIPILSGQEVNLSLPIGEFVRVTSQAPLLSDPTSAR